MTRWGRTTPCGAALRSVARAARTERRSTSEESNLAQRLKARLGRLQVRPQRSRLQPGEADELQLEIERLHHALNGIEDCREGTPRHVLAAELPRDLRRQALAKPMC